MFDAEVLSSDHLRSEDVLTLREGAGVLPLPLLPLMIAGRTCTTSPEMDSGRVVDGGPGAELRVAAGSE